MKDFSFKFGLGTYTVSCDDTVKQSMLTDVLQASNLLNGVLPHRSQQISTFIAACVDDILSFKTKLPDSK